MLCPTWTPVVQVVTPEVQTECVGLTKRRRTKLARATACQKNCEGYRGGAKVWGKRRRKQFARATAGRKIMRAIPRAEKLCEGYCGSAKVWGKRRRKNSRGLPRTGNNREGYRVLEKIREGYRGGSRVWGSTAGRIGYCAGANGREGGMGQGAGGGGGGGGAVGGGRRRGQGAACQPRNPREILPRSLFLRLRGPTDM